MRLLVTGDRHWDDARLVCIALQKLKPSKMCHGWARGADSIADIEGRRLGIDVQGFVAQWNQYGRAAGPIRNQQMLDEFRPTQVAAFHDDLEHSKGTKDMVRRAKKAGIPVRHFSHSHPEGVDL